MAIRSLITYVLLLIMNLARLAIAVYNGEQLDLSLPLSHEDRYTVFTVYCLCRWNDIKSKVKMSTIVVVLKKNTLNFILSPYSRQYKNLK